jgi:hypothetical protein
MRHAVLVSGFLAVAPATYALDVTTCGQTVAAGEVGTLQVDLACPAGAGVHLEDRASLDLNGRAIVATGAAAIACEGRHCTITSAGGSPGDVSGSAAVDCITMTPRGRMEISSVHVHDCLTCIETNPRGVHAEGANVRATAVTVDGCEGPGIHARVVKANGVSVTNARDIALWAEMRLKGADITASGNSWIGIFAVSINAENVVANDNGLFGVESFGKMRIRGGEMLGNGHADVGAHRARFTDVLCGRSVKFSNTPGESLGVCVND